MTQSVAGHTLLKGREMLGGANKIFNVFDKGKEIHLWACWGLGWERSRWLGEILRWWNMAANLQQLAQK